MVSLALFMVAYARRHWMGSVWVLVLGIGTGSCGILEESSSLTSLWFHGLGEVLFSKDYIAIVSPHRAGYVLLELS